jgi:hypothetical protein
LAVAAPKEKSADPGKEKLAKIEALEYATSNGIITFNDKNYE